MVKQIFGVRFSRQVAMEQLVFFYIRETSKADVPENYVFAAKGWFKPDGKPVQEPFLVNYHLNVDIVIKARVDCSPSGSKVNASALLTAYFGWKDTGSILTKGQIEASLDFSNFVPGVEVIADFTANNQPKYLWVAIPVGEPDATSWYGSILNNGSIGGSNDLFKAPVTIGGTYRFYITNYPTQQTQTTINFKH